MNVQQDNTTTAPRVIPQVQGSSNTLHFRRYPTNRKIYSVEGRNYVNFTEIHACLMAGHNVEVVDAYTEEDITRYILTQILFRVQARELQTRDNIELQAMIRGLR